MEGGQGEMLRCGPWIILKDSKPNVSSTSASSSFYLCIGFMYLLYTQTFGINAWIFSQVNCTKTYLWISYLPFVGCPFHVVLLAVSVRCGGDSAGFYKQNKRQGGSEPGGLSWYSTEQQMFWWFLGNNMCFIFVQGTRTMQCIFPTGEASHKEYKKSKKV